MSELWEPQTKHATKPATRWRNRWQVIEKYVELETGIRRFPGEVFWGAYYWPSKDAAETIAAEQMADPEIIEDTYLGAFPVNE